MVETKVKYELCVTYKIVDEDGDKVKINNKSEGATLEEVLKNLDFPKGCNQNVKVLVKVDGKEIGEAVSVASHIGRKIFESKDVAVFKKKFGL